MINPNIYNDRELMAEWYAYRTYNLVSPALYQTMVELDRDTSMEPGVKAMVKDNWFRIMDENLQIAIAKEKGRVAGERFGNAVNRFFSIVKKVVATIVLSGIVIGAAIGLQKAGGNVHEWSGREIYSEESVDDYDSEEYSYINPVVIPGHKPERR
jgi:hypothetical protein